MTYAIFKAAGFQYRAELGTVLRLPSLDAESGETVTFDEVLMGASDGETLIGQPTLEGAKVQAEVIKHGRADKVVVFKFKRRKNYRKKTGHRQNFTEIRVSEIDLGGDYKVSLAEEKKAKKPAEKAKAKTKPEPAAKKKTAKKKTAKKSETKKTQEKKATSEKKGAAGKKKSASKKGAAGKKKSASKKGAAKKTASKTKKKTAEKKGGKSSSPSKKKASSKTKKKES